MGEECRGLPVTSAADLLLEHPPMKGPSMPDSPVDLVLPGDPFIYPVLEQDPVPSRYTGKMLRRFTIGVRARDDEKEQQLDAVLNGTDDGEALIEDQAGGSWKVISRSYSFQPGATPGIHDVEIVEREDLNLDRVEFGGLCLVPDRFSLESEGERTVLKFLATMDAETHQRFEQMLEHHATDPGAEMYFPVTWAGISTTPVSMRFGRCMWQRLDGGGARYSVVLVSEEGDEPGNFNLFEPEMTRLKQQSAILRTRLDALVGELQRAGVLDSEAAARLAQETIDVPFSSLREFDRVSDVELFFD
jgi:hypothetical protein